MVVLLRSIRSCDESPPHSLRGLPRHITELHLHSPARNRSSSRRRGSNIRGRFTLLSVKEFSGAGGSGADLTLAVTVELEGSEKPCCVAEWIVRYYR